MESAILIMGKRKLWIIMFLPNGLTIVISPLIALMKDQVDGLHQNGIKASFINSSLTVAQQQQVINEVQQQKIASAFNQFGTEKLAPVKEFLGEDYSYDDLRWVKAKLVKKT